MKKDTIFFDTRKKAVEQWLSFILEYDDLSVRDGAKATIEYIEDLQKQILMLEETNALKDTYLKRMKEKYKG